jgi:hypothetical protein
MDPGMHIAAARRRTIMSVPCVVGALKKRERSWVR